jgi:energy-coupling factor transporter ATP-binding protein EcfA2
MGNTASNRSKSTTVSHQFTKSDMQKVLNTLNFRINFNQLEKFCVITGINGVGKSRLLKNIQELIVTKSNEFFPSLIVRRLDYGEEPDSYDPDTTNHPLVSLELIEKSFKCEFDEFKSQKSQTILKDLKNFEIKKRTRKLFTDLITKIDNKTFDNQFSTDTNELINYINSADVKSKWKDACKNLSENNYGMAIDIMNNILNMDDIKILDKNQPNNSNDFDRIFNYYYSSWSIEQLDELISSLSSTTYDFQARLYFDEFKKYFRRQILKKLCYGSLEQLLMLNSRYQHDLEKINQTIRSNDHVFNFDYEIEKNHQGMTEKSDINESIIFRNKLNQKTVKYKDLSPGERLILHLILIIKDKDNIKIYHPFDTKIKQVLLLDEPDSHCEPNLVKNFIDVIRNVLVDELDIQVIMTTHNSTTVFSVHADYLYKLENNNGVITLSEGNSRAEAAHNLASNLVYYLDWNQVSFKQLYKFCLDYRNSISENYGYFFEALIKYMTDNDKLNIQGNIFPKYNKNDSNAATANEKYLKFIKDLMDTNSEDTLNHIDQIEFKDTKTQTNNEGEELHDIDLQLYTGNKIYIIWPLKSNNKAWDFMIYDNRTGIDQLYLYQIKSGDFDKSKQAKHHKEILDDFKFKIEKLQNPKIWSIDDQDPFSKDNYLSKLRTLNFGENNLKEHKIVNKPNQFYNSIQKKSYINEKTINLYIRADSIFIYDKRNQQDFKALVKTSNKEQVEQEIQSYVQILENNYQKWLSSKNFYLVSNIIDRGENYDDLTISQVYFKVDITDSDNPIMQKCRECSASFPSYRKIEKELTKKHINTHYP